MKWEKILHIFINKKHKQINFQLDTILFSEKNLFSHTKGHHLNIQHRYSIFHIYSQNEEKREFSPFVTSNVRRKAPRPHNIKPEKEIERQIERETFRDVRESPVSPRVICTLETERACRVPSSSRLPQSRDQILTKHDRQRFLRHEMMAFLRDISKSVIQYLNRSMKSKVILFPLYFIYSRNSKFSLSALLDNLSFS